MTEIPTCLLWKNDLNCMTSDMSLQCEKLLLVHLTLPLGVRSRDNWAVVVSWTRDPFCFICFSCFHFAKRLRNMSAKYWFQLSGRRTTKNPNIMSTTPANFISLNSTWYIDASIPERKDRKRSKKISDENCSQQQTSVVIKTERVKLNCNKIR